MENHVTMSKRRVILKRFRFVQFRFFIGFFFENRDSSEVRSSNMLLFMAESQFGSSGLSVHHMFIHQTKSGSSQSQSTPRSSSDTEVQFSRTTDELTAASSHASSAVTRMTIPLTSLPHTKDGPNILPNSQPPWVLFLPEFCITNASHSWCWRP